MLTYIQCYNNLLIHIDQSIFFLLLLSASAWIETSQMKPYFQYKNRLMKANKTSTFKEAVECIEKYIVENNVKVSTVQENTVVKEFEARI